MSVDELLLPLPRAGRPPLEVVLTGKLFPWRGTGPVFLSVPGSEDLYVPLFSKASSLRAAMARLRVAFVSIKKIDDGHEFLDSIPAAGVAIKVILDLHWTPEGRARWLELQR